MKEKVLSFPHINPPMAPWFTRALLYWDEVGAIVPYSFVMNPEGLDESTRSLIQAGLLKQVIPGFHIWQIPRFSESFLEYLESLGPELDHRRTVFGSPNHLGTCIHVEKLDRLADELWALELATKRDTGPPPKYNWIRVESTTGKEFMCYLASAIGRLDGLGYMPFANERAFEQQFIESSTPKGTVENKVSPLREIVLSDLLPAPSAALHADFIQKFKDLHGDDLRRFRNRIESEIVQIADMADDGLRHRRLELFIQDAKDQVEVIQARMTEFGWARTTLVKLTALVAAIPGVSPLFGLASAVLGAFDNGNQADSASPLLYSALTQVELGDRGPR